jgi:hypothetical protein
MFIKPTENSSRLLKVVFLGLICSVSGCFGVTYQDRGRLSELPLSAYKYVLFDTPKNDIPAYLTHIIASEIAKTGLTVITENQLRDASHSKRAQTLVGEWERLGKTQRAIIGYSQTIRVSLMDPFGRGSVYSGLGEHMGDFERDDLIGATKAALRRLAVYQGFSKKEFIANNPSSLAKNYWDEHLLPKSVASTTKPRIKKAPAPPKSSGFALSRIPAVTGSYSIEAVSNDEILIINGSVFKAKSWCMNWSEGDEVIFIEGSPHGICTWADLFNISRRERCEVWCE